MKTKEGIMEHMHNVASNSSEALATFIGCRVKGVLIGALPVSNEEIASKTRTFVFECGWGFTFSSNGSFWPLPPKDVRSAIEIRKRALEQVQKEIKDILDLA